MGTTKIESCGRQGEQGWARRPNPGSVSPELGDRSKEPSTVYGLHRRWQMAPASANCCACPSCMDIFRLIVWGARIPTLVRRETLRFRDGQLESLLGNRARREHQEKLGCPRREKGSGDCGKMLEKVKRIKLGKQIYRRLMKRVLERDEWRCQKCGSLENLQVHHKIKRGQIGNDSL
jgi:hypothetical protein